MTKSEIVPGELYRNKKTGYFYKVDNIVLNVTGDKNEESVLYRAMSGTMLYVMELSEFRNKFTDTEAESLDFND